MEARSRAISFDTGCTREPVRKSDEDEGEEEEREEEDDEVACMI